MTAKPIVSIVIPAYNRASLLCRAIGSVLAQSFTDFELIVVDDASTDNTEEVVRGFGDPRIRYLRHEENRGGSAARNTGIKAAQGRYIAFQDSDDEWLIEKLEKQVSLLESCDESVGVVYSGMLRWDGQSAVYFPPAKVAMREGDISSQILDRSFIGTPTLLIRRECLERIGGFDERLPRFQDWEMVIRLALTTHFRLVDEPLVIAYDTTGSITRNKAVSVRAREIILDKHFAALEKNPAILAEHYCTIGHLNCLYHSATLGRSWFWKAAKARPMATKAWVGLVLSLLGKTGYKLGLQTLGRNVSD